MNWKVELRELFESETISPSFKEAHIILGLIFIQNHPKGIGRYQLMKNLSLGGGMIRTLLKRLKDRELIKVKTVHSGHVIAKKGELFLAQIREKFSFPREVENDPEHLKMEKFMYYSIVHQEQIVNPLKAGIEQRDKAIMIGASGVTCLVVQGQDLLFPNEKTNKISAQNYLSSKDEAKEGDIICFGTGKTRGLAQLATIAASYSLIAKKTEKNQ